MFLVWKFLVDIFDCKAKLNPYFLFIYKNYCAFFCRYDPTGLGESCEPLDRNKAMFSHWVDDAR